VYLGGLLIDLERLPNATRRNVSGVGALFQIVIGVLVLCLTVGCTSRTATLLASLPNEAGGVQFDIVQVVDEEFEGGHPVDDVLAALDKTRRDAHVVFRESARGDGGIGGLSVDGVSGPVLLDAVVEHWAAAAVIRRTEADLGARSGWLVETRTSHFTFAYQRGDALYFALSYDLAKVERFLMVMP
jgi:hypothetical protein